MHVDDYVCSKCRAQNNLYEKSSYRDPNPVCECGEVMEKNWAHCRVMALNNGEPVNSRLCNDGKTINRFHANDDPLCQIEVGLKSDGFSGTRTFSREQAEYFRGKIQKGEDSTKLRQEILDTRAKNESEKQFNRKKKDARILGV